MTVRNRLLFLSGWVTAVAFIVSFWAGIAYLLEELAR